MAVYSPTRPPQPNAKSRPIRSQSMARIVGKLLAIGWLGLFAFGLVMAIVDDGLPSARACGRLAVVSLLCCLLTAVAMRFRPEHRALRTLAAAVVGFPAGVLALGVVLPHEAWPPPAPMWWMFGAAFSAAFAWGTLFPD